MNCHTAEAPKELLVQKYLRANGLEKLSGELGIEAKFHPTEPLVILNYSQTGSPKTDPVVRECRALTLHSGTGDVVARSFPRFFREGECPDEELRFDWGDFVADEKVDGSLMVLYHWNGLCRVNTRGSFADGKIHPDFDRTWEETFFGLVNEVEVDHLSKELSYVFELCTRYNKVVTKYPEDRLYLLSAFNVRTGGEATPARLDATAQYLGVLRPKVFRFSSLEETKSYIEENAKRDPDWDGVVLRDRNGMRLKVKSASYDALHQLRGNNGDGFSARRLVPLVMNGNYRKVTDQFPEFAGRLFDVAERVGGAKARMMAVWDAAKPLPGQKEFALFVTQHTPLSGILFNARKSGEEPEAVWRRSEDYILKRVS